LWEASKRGRVVCLFVYEPELLAAPDHDSSHLVFANQCLVSLRSSLRRMGGDLTLRVGRVPEVFDRLAEELAPAGGLEAIYSHEETGGDVSYRRDRQVARWSRRTGVRWIELPQHGVVRPLRSRDGWAKRWHQRMAEPELDLPTALPGLDGALPGFDHGQILGPDALGLPASGKEKAQPGGEERARRLLHGFLFERGENYRADMSSPVEGWNGCSRLSPHLAFGSLSIRQVYRAARARRDELKELPSDESIMRWRGSISSFLSRLRWHCHFMQKLEDEPAIEFRNMNRAYDDLRPRKPDPERLAAWRSGRTGYPMVDACMRCLHSTGWINFRMRAMLASFASYHLWLHWREPAIYLARQFVDFEPGIHYSQFQMQSGVTGINTVRVYSPAKQVKDQDPTGAFVRRWLPELEAVPEKYLPEPHTMPELTQRMANCRIGVDYPAPIVDHRQAYREARERIFAVRRTDFAKEEAARVYLKHGSRRRPTSGAGRGAAKAS
ncbi:MAG: deoxyribodipyrimidine photo-lyase/cryptochrome family protein, partial [Acidobacteriota bacterium]